MKIFTILCLFLLTLSAAKLTKNGDSVIDDKNRMMWQDSKENVQVLLTQEDAINYCKKLNTNGFSDWRLPSVEEYKTIIDKSRTRVNLMINKAFRYTLREDYWSSDRTWTRNFGHYGYYVFFKSGSVYYQNRSYPKYVRCVRGLK